MGVQLVGRDGNQWTPKDMDASSNNKVTVYGMLAFTGSYPTGVGGDTLDLSPCASYVPSALLPDSVTWETNGPSASFGGQGGYYQIAKGAALNAYKIKLFQAGGSEEGNSTYANANVTGTNADIVTVQITFTKNNS